MSGANPAPAEATAENVTGSEHAARSRAAARQLALLLAGIFLLFLIVGKITEPVLVLPEREESFAELVHVWHSNLTLLVVLAALAALQPLAREHARRGSSRWLAASTAIAVTVLLAVNVAYAGFAIGQVGLPAVERLILHAPFEIAGFALAVWAYILARFGALPWPRAALLFASAAALLLGAAPIEVYLSGGMA